MNDNEKRVPHHRGMNGVCGHARVVSGGNGDTRATVQVIKSNEKGRILEETEREPDGA